MIIVQYQMEGDHERSFLDKVIMRLNLCPIYDCYCFLHSVQECWIRYSINMCSPSLVPNHIIYTMRVFVFCPWLHFVCGQWRPCLPLFGSMSSSIKIASDKLFVWRLVKKKAIFFFSAIRLHLRSYYIFVLYYFQQNARWLHSTTVIAYTSPSLTTISILLF